MRALSLAIASALLVGCGSSNPPQPTLSDTQVKEVMDKAKGQHDRESGGRGGPPRR